MGIPEVAPDDWGTVDWVIFKARFLEACATLDFSRQPDPKSIKGITKNRVFVRVNLSIAVLMKFFAIR
jgi:hypothetical protein